MTVENELIIEMAIVSEAIVETTVENETIVEITVANETIVEMTVEDATIVEMIDATIVMSPGIIMENLGRKPAAKEDHVAGSGQRFPKIAMTIGTKKMNIKTLNGTPGASRPRMILKIDLKISTVIEQIIDVGSSSIWARRHTVSSGQARNQEASPLETTRLGSR